MYKQCLWATLGSTLIGVSMTPDLPAQAAMLSYNFQVDITNGPLAGKTYQGSFSYDENAVANVQQSFPISSFTFEFENKVYTEKSLLAPTMRIKNGQWQPNFQGGLPVYTAQGGTVSGFYFSNFNPFSGPHNFFILNYDGAQATFRHNHNLSAGVFDGTVRLQQVIAAPEPSLVLGMLVSLGFLAKAQRHRRRVPLVQK